MSIESGMPDEFMERLYREALGLGYVHGLDFAVWGIPTSQSSEVVELGKEGDDYLLFNRDMGRRYERLRSNSVDDVRREFMLEVGRLAGPRGRGPYAGAPAPSRAAGLTKEQIIQRIMSRPKDING